LRPGVQTDRSRREDGSVADTILGVDIGGSGIKGAPVDLVKGDFAAERVRVPTPQPADVKSVIKATREVVNQFDGVRRVGITFPGVVVNGVVKTAANMDRSWIDTPAAQLFSAELGKPVVVLNDADAAGIAEVTYGVGKGRLGTLLMLTFGTGIGSALFLDGKLVPNTELGHLEFDGMEAEARASGRARMERKLDWAAYINELNYVLNSIHALFWPDLIVLCGGITADNPNLCDDLKVRSQLKVGALRADAGIVGAAYATTLAQGVWIKPAKVAGK
jgi:polyphosphate glucokinase